jgi:hypothetical protein
MANEYEFLDSWDNPHLGLGYRDEIAGWSVLTVAILLFAF